MFHQTDRSFRARRFSHILPIVIALISLFILLPHRSEATPQVGVHDVAPSPVLANNCFAQISSGTTFSSTTAQAVRDAVLTATANSTVKIAGYCPGVQAQSGSTQTVLITKTLSLAGGYTTTNWTSSYPITQPTILDAQNGGRVLYFNGVAGTVSNLTVQNGNIISNTGGGIFAQSALTLTDVIVMSNTSTSNGGGVYATDAATLIGGLFQNNIISGFYGGGLYAKSTLVLTGTQFLSNTVPHGDGGGVYAFGAATLNGGLFQNNTSPGFSGGGIYASHAITLTGTQFLSNSSGDGGGVYANSAATLSGGTFQNNSAGYGGGGLWVTGAATLNGGLFQNNTADGTGGGLFAYSTLALTGTQFISNTGARGGGISYSLFGSGNNGRIVNALFARNVATSTLGAAVYLYTPGSGSVQILHTTIASPTLGSGSAIYIATGTVGITDTIISNYSIGISRTNGAVYENYNLFSGTTISRSGSFVASSGTNDVIGDPKFADPASDNYHLRFGSAAIGRAINVGVNFDLDGNPRPGITGFDIGAYQYTGALFRIYLPLALKNF